MAFLKSEAEYEFVKAVEALITDSRDYWIGGFTQNTGDIEYSDYIANDISDSEASGEKLVSIFDPYSNVYFTPK